MTRQTRPAPARAVASHRVIVLLLLIAAVGGCGVDQSRDFPDIVDVWDFPDPAGSQAQFEQLAREAEEVARAEGKTLSAVIQEALRLARRQRLRRELRGIRGYWSRLAKEKGILSEKDLERYLAD